MPSIMLSIVGRDEYMQQLLHTSKAVPGVSISTPQPLDVTGEGLAFPIDPASISDVLEVATGVFGTAAAVVAFWKACRSSPSSVGHKASEQVLIADVRSGKIIYQGDVFDEGIAELVCRAIQDSDET